MAQMEEQKHVQQRMRIQKLRDQRNIEKSKIKDAIMMHKKEEAKQTKFVNLQGKQRQQQFNYQMAQENHMKAKIQQQQEQI